MVAGTRMRPCISRRLCYTMQIALARRSGPASIGCASAAPGAAGPAAVQHPPVWLSLAGRPRLSNLHHLLGGSHVLMRALPRFALLQGEGACMGMGMGGLQAGPRAQASQPAAATGIPRAGKARRPAPTPPAVRLTAPVARVSTTNSYSTWRQGRQGREGAGASGSQGTIMQATCSAAAGTADYRLRPAWRHDKAAARAAVRKPLEATGGACRPPHERSAAPGGARACGSPAPSSQGGPPPGAVGFKGGAV